jgi:hypothetical protein
MTLYRAREGGQVSVETAEILSPLIRQYEAGKLRFKRSGPRSDDPNHWRWSTCHSFSSACRNDRQALTGISWRFPLRFAKPVAMPRKSQSPPQPSRRTIYTLAGRQTWIGEVEASTDAEAEAVEKAAADFKQHAPKLMAVSRG